MATIPARTGLGHRYGVAIALFLAIASTIVAQPLDRAPVPSAFHPSPVPLPADVLTPNTRQNTPYLKVGLRAGLNWAAYANDRYLDNTALDVGRTSGEQAIYSHAAGFGFGGGLELEYPINTGLSVVGTIEYAKAHFGKEGPVTQECVSPDGLPGLGSARHEWDASLGYLKFGGAVKLAFPSFYLLGGLTANRILHSRIARSRAFDGDGCAFAGSGGLALIEEDAPLDDPAGLHFALRTGFGLVYPIADGLQFSPELTLDFGTSAINKSTESDLDIYSVSAVLRYELR